MNKLFLIIFIFLFTITARAGIFFANEERSYTQRTHVVQPKETLYKISRQHGISIGSIRADNGLQDNIISAGARLKINIPVENDFFQIHIVRVEESIDVISEKYQMPLDILRKYNNFDENVVFPGQRIFIKLDKISTKYTYAGEEDEPLTDAELAAPKTEFNVTTSSNTNQNNSFPPEANNTYTPPTNNTPLYILSDKGKGTSLTDSVVKAGKAFTIEGMVDAYYAQYSDKQKQGELANYAIAAPRHNQTGINNVQLAAIYTDSFLRGNITFQYGDMVNAVYPTDYKYLQQANVGVKVVGRLWMDAGFFRSPVSVEDFPNRSNFGNVYTYTRFYEPVLMSGAKLGWEAKSWKLTGFVADRTFSMGNAINTLPSYGLSLKIYGGKHWLLGINSMYTQRAQAMGTKGFLYSNFFVATQRKHLDMLVYANYARQENKSMMSAILSVRYKITSKFSLFAKGEHFLDSSGVVSPLMTGTDGIQQGLSATAIGGGIEIKARANHYLRIEARQTQLGSNFKIFPNYFGSGGLSNQRLELVISTGIWFGK